MEVMLTGDRPTGALHLGHYVGSIKQRLVMQNSYNSYIMIANTQGLTDYFMSPEKIKNNIFQVLEDYIACGIDVDKVKIFVQSEIKALFEISMYFMNLITLAKVRRNPTIKTEIKERGYKENIPCGFLCYPVFQAADIATFLTDIVPVGRDQEPIIEQTNDIIDTFNNVYNCSVFKRCRAYFSDFPKLMGIDGRAKASKSLGNAILLNDSDSEVKRKVFAMYTDPDHIRITDPGKVEGNMVFHYLDAFYSDKEHLLSLKIDYKKGGLGDFELKNLLLSVLLEFLGPIRERRALIDRKKLVEILEFGSKTANLEAEKVLKSVKNAMFLNVF